MTPLTKEQRQLLAVMAATELGLLVMNGFLEVVENEPTPNRAVVSDSLYEAARAIAQERTAKLRALRSALSSSDMDTALNLARVLCGMEQEDGREASNRTRSRIY